MKILILSSFKYQSLSGQGLILTNLIDYFIQNRIDFEIIYFRLDKNYQSNSISIKQEVRNFILPNLTSKKILFNIFNLKLSSSEYEFLNCLKGISGNYQNILLFTSAFEPMLSLIPKSAFVPVIYNITDSITLFEKNRKTVFYNFRIIIAKFIENKILSSGFKYVVYVGLNDCNCAKKIVANKFKHIVHIPLGVNTSVFKPHVTSFNNKIPVILFTGILSYLPNHEACVYIINKILPRIKSPYIFKIVGKNPSSELYRIASKNKFIEITGYVEDISKEYQKADIYFCPMLSGAGMKNKILEALSSGLPVITSNIEKSSFELIPEGISFCGNDYEFIEQIEFFLNNRIERIFTGQKGREFILNNLTWGIRNFKLIKLLR